MLLKNKVEIEDWLKKYGIKNYELIPDDEYGYVVNVNKYVDFFDMELKNIDVKFNYIDGDFDCSYNNLTSLEGCPKMVNGNFDCDNNNLKSLKGGIEIVNGDFHCGDNKLISLEGCPKIVKCNFFCSNNKLSIDGIINLLNLEMKGNYIELHNNKKLIELNKINNFNEIKKILKIYQEKENLDIVMKNSFNIMNKEIIDKTVEIKDKSLVKINKI